ncbi:polysaccharide polymerase [[Clostridium] sordellii]|uniref:EpsG family protein n=1 Tax=Paraclostridium sordellii TaxID=1505 RepID=UPI0005DE2309|nr:EpsG family protein [Paeniclostridium sordellii]CEN76502.1 polysaccharide polymerase [[Clostridium] sordellii] [Paeniclostridium sordellii]
MILYVINIILIIVWAVLLLSNNKYRGLFCTIVAFQWIIISGFRHVSVGVDTYSYKVNFFDKIKYMSWEDIISNFYNIVFLGGEGKDPGYEVLQKIFHVFSDNYQLFLIFIAMVFTIPMARFIYKYSKEPCLSFIIYSCLFYSFFAITGHRQTIVTGVAVFLGYELIKERKFLKFLAIILIMSTIHKSVICLIPFYLLATKKITKIYSIFMISLFILIFVLKNKIMYVLANLTGYEDYADQFTGAGAWNFTVIFIVVILVALWKYPKIMKNDNVDITIWYNATFMALICIPLTFVDPSAMRIVQYFSVFIMLLIPEVVASFNIKERVLIYYMGIALMILLFAKRNPQYLFFWQGGM